MVTDCERTSEGLSWFCSKKRARVLKGCSFFGGSTHPSDLLSMLELLPAVLTSGKVIFKLCFDLKLESAFYLFALWSPAGSAIQTGVIARERPQLSSRFSTRHWCSSTFAPRHKFTVGSLPFVLI